MIDIISSMERINANLNVDFKPTFFDDIIDIHVLGVSQVAKC